MKRIYKTSLLSSLAVLAYIVIVALIMQNGERIFGKMNDAFGPIAFLLLFTLSAFVVGVLTLGKPISLYLDGKKSEAIQTVGFTGLWLALFTILAMIILVII